MKAESYKISLFQDLYTNTQRQITLNEYFKSIINGKWQDKVIAYRAKKIKDNKNKVPAVMASGHFSGRSDKDLLQHSGVLVIDIDAKDQTIEANEIKETLKEIPELFAVHYSLGGEGLAAYFRIRKNKHFESYEAIAKMLVNDYGIIPDMHCSNIGRLRFVSYDPDTYLNYGASQWKSFEKVAEKKQENQIHHVFSENDIDYVLQQVKQRAINIAPDYYSWLRIGFALASQLGEGGRSSFKLISSFYYDKQNIEPDKQYTICLKSDAKRSGTSIKTFFYYAKQAGCNIVSERTKKITTVGRIRRKQEGQSSGSIMDGKTDAKKYLRDHENIEGSDVDDVLNQIWDKPISEIQTDESTLAEIETYLKTNYTLKFNEVSGIVEVDGIPITDYIFNSIYLKCLRIVEKASKDKVFDLIHSDFTPQYNPIHDWFNKYKNIKPKGNVRKLAESIQSKYNTDFVEHFLRKWLLGIIASAYGTFSVLCFVLTGMQGTRKTNFFRFLLPEDLRWLFSINKLDGKEADIAMAMAYKLLICDDEFGGKSKQDEKRFKELISKDVFTVRKPYGRYLEDMNRLAVLCGTSNEEQVINDLTGNRRIIPIHCDNINQSIYDEIDKTELFIELYHEYRKDPDYFMLTGDDIAKLNELTYEAQQVSPEVELALVYFSKSDKMNPRSKFLATAQIQTIIEQRSNKRISTQKLSLALKNIGFEKDTKRVNGQLLRGFWLIVNDYEMEKIEDEKDDLPF